MNGDKHDETKEGKNEIHGTQPSGVNPRAPKIWGSAWPEAEAEAEAKAKEEAEAKAKEEAEAKAEAEAVELKFKAKPATLAWGSKPVKR
ncbi:hypothetical protein H0H92_011402 [Tricholoma furcatifolium]|nr:hypothetical protein H0H92_011402 [Tricholoma furcatifolium]